MYFQYYQTGMMSMMSIQNLDEWVEFRVRGELLLWIAFDLLPANDFF